jgi:hypothetical protein
VLDQCAAYLIAQSERHAAALERMARLLGFAHIEPLLSRGDFEPSADRPTLKFFLMYRAMDARLMIKVRSVIRASRDDNVRYSPIILFTDDCSFETYLSFIELGFDDVLTLPDKKEMLIKRLEAQINTDHTYYETANYLGPDRRRMESSGHVDPRRGGEPASYSKYIVHRTPATGSKAVRSEVFTNLSSNKREQLQTM